MQCGHQLCAAYRTNHSLFVKGGEEEWGVQRRSGLGVTDLL